MGKTTTFELKDDDFRDMKITTAEKGQTMKTAMAEAVRLWLLKNQKKVKA